MPTATRTTTRSTSHSRVVSHHRTSTVVLTWVLAAVVVAATLYGLFADAYRETPARDLLGATLRGQDVLTLLSAPALVATTWMARHGSFRAHLVSLGILLYLPYTYLMYVVVPYNDAFLLYVAVIGLGSWLFADGLLRIDVHAVHDGFARVPRRAIGWFQVVTGTLFAAMWLVQNLAVVPGGVPDGLFVYDIPSTVHVLDLAYILPMLVAAGVLLLRHHPAGGVLAAVMLIKMLTLGLALLSMNAGLAAAGSTVNPGETAVWATIVLASGGFLTALLRRMEAPSTGWLRPSVWCAPAGRP